MSNPDTVIQTDVDNGVTPGRIEGGLLKVTADGAAAYTLPLWVPPGRRGIQPNLALQYHSRGGNGTLGVGWSLSGLPQITRCRKTVADDGSSGALRFDISDEFCLDGERLVLVSGTHGLDGAEYRTKRDTFTKIILHDVDSADDGRLLGPTWFEAFYKDGRIFTFGGLGASDLGSRFEGFAERFVPIPISPTASDRQAQDAVTILTLQVRYAWSVSNIRDRSGNTLIVYYDGYPPAPGPPAPRDYLPKQILYTGSPIDGTAASRTVDFIWEERPDLETRFMSGLRLVQKKRLRELRMSGPDPIDAGLLRRYTFGYRNDSISGRSLLTSVQEFDRFGVAKRGHSFEWEPGQLTYRQIDTGIKDIKTTPAGRSNLPGRLRVADFNGDGRDDLLYVPLSDANQFYILLADDTSPTGFSPPFPTGIRVPAEPVPPEVVPVARGPYVFPDAASDFMNIFVLDTSALPGTQGYPTYRVFQAGIDRSGASGSIGSFWVFRGRAIFDPAGFVEGIVEVADLDGDGLPDLLHGDLTGVVPVWSLRLNLGGNLNFGNEQFKWLFPVDHYFANLNGDNAAALLIDGSGALGADPRYSALELRRNGINLSPSIALTTLLRDQQYVFADVSGSGLPSAFSLGYSTKSDPTLAENVGGSFSTPIPFVLNVPAPPSPDTPLIRVIDWDQDGSAELALRIPLPAQGQDPQRQDQVMVLKWTGNGFTQTPLPFPSIWRHRDQFEMFEVFDYNGNGLDDVVMFSDGELRLFIREGKKADLMTAIVDGLGARTVLVHAPISDPAVHTPESGRTYPNRAIAGKVWVVAEYREDDGIGGVNTYRYQYKGAVNDVCGEGFLGFRSRDVLHAETGITDHTTYFPDFGNYLPNSGGPPRPTYPFVGLPLDEVTRVPLPNGVEQITTRHWDYALSPGSSQVPYFVFPKTVIEERVENKNGTPTMPIRRRTVTQQVDLYGNVTNYSEAWSDGNQYGYSAAYFNTPNSWLIGLMDTISEHSTSPSGLIKTRIRAYEYDAQGLTARVIIEPGTKGLTGYAPLGPQADGVKTLFQSFDRYPNGNVYRIVEEETTELTGTKRSKTFIYDDLEHIFVTDVADDLGHHARGTYHPGLAVIAMVEDENGAQLIRQYDGFGRLRHEAYPSGDDVTIHYLSAAGKPRLTSEHGTGPRLVLDFDVLGRAITQTTFVRDDGAATMIDVEYDGLGRVKRVSRPRFPGTAPSFDTFSYDILGRPSARIAADGSTSSNEYRGEWIIATDANQNAIALLLDNLDRVVFSTDRDAALVGTVQGPSGMTHDYGPFDALNAVTDIAGNRTDMTRDRFGRLIALKDPDRGQRAYQYNAFGDLEEETKGKNQIVRYHFDAIGRLTRIEDAIDGDVQYIWDTAANGIGKLARVMVPGTGIETSYAYDKSGRPATKKWTIATESYAVATAFDGVGRLAAITYPQVGKLKPLTVGYSYGNFGQLLSAFDASTKYVYWRYVSSDASGLFGEEESGSGLSDIWKENPSRPGVLNAIQTLDSSRNFLRNLVYGFDANLNVQSRNDKVVGTREKFEYDAFNRLRRWTWKGTVGTRRTRWDYDDIGNVLMRAIEAGPGTDLTYTYSPKVVGPHEVASTSLGTYTYDAKGNQVSAPGRTVTYGRGDLPTRLIRAMPKKFGPITFLYDGEMSRVREIDQTTKTTTDRLIGLYEFRRPSGKKGPNGDHLFVISFNGRPIARRKWSVASKALAHDRLEYIHTDHQSSIDLVTSASGKVVQRFKYDPFGRRVSVSDPANPPVAPKTDLHTGYTSHEHLEGWELIDMRGRFYDSILAKFLTPDPIVPSPLKPPSWNPYAYVLNNPVSLRDPTGFDDDANGDTVTVVGDKTFIEFGTGSTVVGDRPAAPPSAPAQASPPATPDPPPPPPPPTPPPPNDDGLGGAAHIGLPINPGLRPANRGDWNRAAKDPAEIFLRLDRARTERLEGNVPFASRTRNRFHIGIAGTVDVALLLSILVPIIIEVGPAAATYLGGVLGMRAVQATASGAVATLAAALQKLQSILPEERLEAFEGYVQDIEAASGGAWQATVSNLPGGGAVWTGTMGNAVVINNAGQVFLGNYNIAGQFVLGPPTSPLLPVFENLKLIIP